MKGEGCGPLSFSPAGPFPAPVCAPLIHSDIAHPLTCCQSVWFHVPDTPSTAKPETEVEERARNIIEKRTAINLVEAFSVAVKHYLRGEEGIYYEDLYHLVKFLPAYSLPAGMPNQRVKSRTSAEIMEGAEATTEDDKARGSWSGSTSTKTQLPTSNREGRASFQLPTVSEKGSNGLTSPGLRRGSTVRRPGTHYRRVSGPYGEVDLAPASNPPKWGAFDVWPLSLLVKLLTKSGKSVSGKKAAKERAKHTVISHNIPLEITLYMVRASVSNVFAVFNFLQSSYISALQQRKVVDVPTISRPHIMFSLDDI